MKKQIVSFLLLAACAATCVGQVTELPQPKRVAPVKIIFDTDMGNDCDDAMALALVHALQNRAAAELLAVTLTNPDPLAGRLVDAINTFYGRPNIPIGVNPQAPFSRESRFLKIATDYPHDFDPATAPHALKLLRQTLAKEKDGSVTLVQVGFFTNLAALLESTGDEFSPLSGVELVKKKVKELQLMAGAFGVMGNTNYTLEFNVRFDIRSAQKVAREWPTPMIWSGGEIGEAVPFPAAVVERDFGYVKRHPIYESYQLFRATPHERPCYDLTSVLQAVWPDRGYFGMSVPGRVEVKDDGFTRFTPARESKSKRDRFLVVDKAQAALVRELFAALVTEAPAATVAK